MRILAVFAALPRELEWRGRRALTGFFKRPVEGPVLAARTGLEGDGVGDPEVHGGADKAVYAYPSEHYPLWRAELGRELPYGMFGENLTVEGLDEASLCVGDRLRAGGALLEAAEPRLPCWKLGMRFDDEGMVRRFLAARRFGAYFRVLEEGPLEAGAPLVLEARGATGLRLHELARLRHEPEPEGLQSALKEPRLPAAWRLRFEKRLGTLG